MFLGSFAWSFVFVSLPFHIQRLSTTDPVSTLRWTGWILGISSLVTVATAPFWGRFAARGDPKTVYVAVEALQGVGFFGMALARTLPELFLARFVLGGMGAASTVAYIIVGRTGRGSEVRRRIATLQSGMTVGQVIGPLIGAIAAARFGFRASFVVGGAILLACAAMVHWLVEPPPQAAAAPSPDARPVQAREVGIVAQILLPLIGIGSAETLEIGRTLIFVSGVAAALGAMAVPRLADLFAESRLIGVLLVTSSLWLAAFAAAGSVWLYGTLRFLQVLSIAPVFPLVVARVVQHAGGGAIGFINSARIAAGFIGPVLATTLLTWTSPAALYLLLAAIGLACVPLVRMREAGARA